MNTLLPVRLRAVLLVTFASVLVAAAPRPALAQNAGAGIRGGVSGSPDQFYFGAHYDTGPLIERLSFRPNLEVGLGDDTTTFAANLEFVYHFPLRRQPWSLYAGGGPALNIYRWDGGRDDASHTDSEPGFNVLVGLAHRQGLFTEFKVGFIDSPDIRFGIGYSWR